MTTLEKSSPCLFSLPRIITLTLAALCLNPLHSIAQTSDVTQMDGFYHKTEALHSEFNPSAKIKIHYLSKNQNKVRNAQLEDISGRDLSKGYVETVDPTNELTKFYLCPAAKNNLGLNQLNAYWMAAISDQIYLHPSVNKELFTKMGFTEIHYLSAGLLWGTFGAILKNDHSIVIVFRGTEPKTIVDLITDALFLKSDLSDEVNSIRLHSGFLGEVNKVWPVIARQIVPTYENKIRALNAEQKTALGLSEEFKALKPDHRPIYLTGHSLGAALSTIVTLKLMLKAGKNEYNSLHHLFPNWSTQSHEKRLAAARVLTELYQDNRAILPFSIGDNFLERFAQQDSTESLKTFLVPPITVSEENGFEKMDDRIRNLITFGSPRIGNYTAKYALDRYTKKAGTLVVRYQNIMKTPNGKFIGDLVARIPGGGKFREILEEINSFRPYRHIGYRASLNTFEDAPEESRDWVCRTGQKDEPGLNLSLSNLINLVRGLSIRKHAMPEYFNALSLSINAENYSEQAVCRNTADPSLPPSCQFFEVLDSELKAGEDNVEELQDERLEGEIKALEAGA